MPTPLATSAATQPRWLDRVRDACRVRHYSIRTEQAYVDWIRRFILFHARRLVLAQLTGTQRAEGRRFNNLLEKNP